MKRSESVVLLTKALVKAKLEMESPSKNKINPHFKNAYADLAGVKASYQAALGKHGLSVVNALGYSETISALLLTTTLIHESGEWVASDYPIPASAKAQETGSAVTYGRRYNVCALLDIVAEDDDDGNAAQNGAAKEAKAAPVPAPAPKPSVLTNDEILSVQALAKKAGYKNSAELAPVLGNIVPGVTKASELSKADLKVVLEALESMAARAVSA